MVTANVYSEKAIKSFNKGVDDVYATIGEVDSVAKLGQKWMQKVHEDKISSVEEDTARHIAQLEDAMKTTFRGLLRDSEEEMDRKLNV